MSTDHQNMGQSVGAKLRAARQARKYTQQQLASPDFSVSYVSAIERGQIHPSLRALEILARRLNLSSTQLLPERSQNNSTTSHVGTPFNDDETIAELALLEAQIHLLHGAAAEALIQLKKLPTRVLRNQFRIRYRYLLGWAYFLTAEMQSCEDILLEAEKLAIEHNDTYSRIHAANILGMAYATMSNHQQALLVHQRCLEIVEHVQPQDSFFLCHLYNRLGEHHTNLGNFESALAMFNEAIALAESLSTAEQLQTTYWTLAQHYHSTTETHLASLYAHKSLFLYSQPVDSSLKSSIYHYLGRALLKGDSETARAFLEDALSHPKNSQDALSQASLTCRLAEWHLLQQQLTQAEQLAEQAYQLALSFGDTPIAADVLLIHGRINYAQQRIEEGDSHFVAGLALLERIGLHEEVSDQSALYAQLLDEHERLSEAITYYKRAFESRRHLGSYN